MKKNSRVEYVELKNASKNFKLLQQLSTVQWVILLIYSICFMIFAVRPALFLIRGLTLNILPPTPFVNLNYVIVFAKVIFVYLTILYLTYQITGLVGRFVYTVYCLFNSATSLAILVLMGYYLSQANKITQPANPASSIYFCCKYGPLVPECQISPLPLPNCAVSAGKLDNLKPNPSFIEYFVWIGIFTAVELAIYFIQYEYIRRVNLVDKEKLAEKNYNDTDVESQNIGSKYSTFNEHDLGQLKSRTRTPGSIHMEQQQFTNQRQQPTSLASLEFKSGIHSGSILHDILKTTCSKLLEIGSKLTMRNKNRYRNLYFGMSIDSHEQ